MRCAGEISSGGWSLVTHGLAGQSRLPEPGFLVLAQGGFALSHCSEPLDVPSQGNVRVPWEDLKGKMWRLKDIFTTEVYERDGEEMYGQGLYVDLRLGFHFLEWL
jgi:hypothetical protein